MGQMCGNPSLILITKNVRRVTKKILSPGAFSDISNVNLDLCHVCYITLKSFLKPKSLFLDNSKILISNHSTPHPHFTGFPNISQNSMCLSEMLILAIRVSSYRVPLNSVQWA